MLTILSVQFGDIKHIHIIVQPSPPSISRPFFLFNQYFKDFIYLFLERREGREKERERNIPVQLPIARPLLGTWTATQACALSGNQTSDPSVRRPTELHQPGNSRTLSSLQTETLYPPNSKSPFPLPPVTDNHCFTFCLTVFDYSRYLIWWESSNIRPFCPAYSNQPNALKEHPCCVMYQFHFLLRLNNIPAYLYTTFCFSIHPLMNIWVASTFWLW